jgi:hypothetical protein
MANDTIVSFANPAFHDEFSDLVRKKAVLKLAFADQLAYAETRQVHRFSCRTPPRCTSLQSKLPVGTELLFLEEIAT